MSQTKAQLIEPIGVVTASGIVVSGVATAPSFDGDIVGSASSVIQGKNLNLGALNAVSFAGDFTGNATGIITSSAIKVGQLTASSFVGDFTGTATSMAKGTGFKAGTVTATPANVTYTVTVSSKTGGGNAFYLDGIEAPTPSLYPGATYTFDQAAASNDGHPLRFATAADAAGSTEYTFQVTTNGTPGNSGAWTKIVVSPSAPDTLYYYCTNHSGMGDSINITNMLQGAVTGAVTGDIKGNISGNITGNVTGDASGHAGGLGVNYNGGWTGAGTSQINAGVVTATFYHGDGSNLDGVSSGPVSAQAVTANGATTTIDFSNGNLIYMTQSADTTVSFANSENGNAYIVRTKDDNTTARTITWPDRLKWDGGVAPTLLDVANTGDAQVFNLVTRDEGVTWYGKELMSNENPTTYNLFVWGGNTQGAAGLNNRTKYSSPTQVPGDWIKFHQGGTTWYNSSAGAPVFLARGTSGQLWGMGYNQYGNLGQNSTTRDISSPVQIPGTNWAVVRSVVLVGAYATKTDGSLWSWGYNNLGALGLNNRTSHSSPVQVGTDTTWPTTEDQLSSLSYGATAIKTDGTLWTWGRGAGGALGKNNTTNYSSPVQVPGTWANAKLARGGNNGAANHVVKSDGTLWNWGYNEMGELGHNNTTDYSSPKQLPGTNWSHVRRGDSCVLGFKTDGTLWAWGYGVAGMLAQNNNTTYSSPRQVGTDTNWSDAVSSTYSWTALKTDGTLWTWGLNDNGQLGNNTIDTTRSSPIQIPGTWNSIASATNRTFFALKS